MPNAGTLNFLEVCAGAGGLALGLEHAGFTPVGLVENDAASLETLRKNRPSWPLIQEDLKDFDPVQHPAVFDVDLLSAGTPRVKSTATINRRSDEDERDLVAAALYLVGAVKPRAVLIENVPGLVDNDEYSKVRGEIEDELRHLGFRLFTAVLNACDFGVPQERRHGFFVALREPCADAFSWPRPVDSAAPTVGEVLHRTMTARGWEHASAWASRAQRLAPTLVGGSDRRGGPDLGPTRAKKIWAEMGINGGTVADEVPEAGAPWDLDGDVKNLPALTVSQAALLQGFPASWQIAGRKTRSYRQVGQAVPPPLAAAVGRCIAAALAASSPGGS
ncbi:DNA cytosine methyltransferase [Streptomyces sp. NPDC045456]|uniref:DNA cytosine methyltransferase n=1 Tax=Streptomyces sp. NPDC045456 TaxID=3155254 RepID=UPI0033E0398C